VAARKAHGEVNVPPPSPGRSYRQIILGNIFSFVNNVFYSLCLLLVLLGRPLDAILPLVAVLANAGVSVPPCSAGRTAATLSTGTRAPA
jgi:hypothetical protein